MKIPDRLLEEMDFAYKLLGDSADWVSFKKVMLRSLPSNLRKNFSTRDSKTKDQHLNLFERKLIDIYKNRTSIELRLED